ncbi:MAG: GNAT family N-acetyltransferase [Bacteroidales bacterium]|nr:GNAT family N-acetyltransferase [Bacteroidales bacterium]
MIKHYKSLDKRRIEKILRSLSVEYIPNLAEQVDIDEYAGKLARNASFILYQEDNTDFGIIGYYLNNEFAFISTFGLHSNYQGKGIAKKMFECFISNLGQVRTVFLEVHVENLKAKNFYNKLGFEFNSRNHNTLKLIKKLDGRY